MSWSPTRLYVGHGVADSVISSLVRGRVTLIVTDAFNAFRTATLQAHLQSGMVVIDGPTLGSIERIYHEIGMRSPGAIVAVGGGTVMDSAKLAFAVAASGRSFTQFRRVLQCGGEHATRRDLRRSGGIVVAVPTTVGTASEVSPIACVTTADGHRLVSGDDLRPDFAVIDSTHFDSLSGRKVRDGAYEILLRIAAVAISTTASPLTRRRAVDLGERIVRACIQLAEEEAPDARTDIALIGAESKTSFTGFSSDPHAIYHWYFANELAHAGALSKVEATSALAPTIWRLLEQGHLRLGDQDALRAFWSTMRRMLPLESSRASEWISAFAQYLSIVPPKITAKLASRAADSCIRAWGGSNMALADWDAVSIRALYEETLVSNS
ncbi:iron-containing alcohol dehydrogenase [Rathayibacter iranicus]|nr:iron-containing alcohol dehydrogenase [Rathayibacter iranicus]